MSRQSAPDFADDISKRIFNENIWISINNSMAFVLKKTFVPVMTLHSAGTRGWCDYAHQYGSCPKQTCTDVSICLEIAETYLFYKVSVMVSGIGFRCAQFWCWIPHCNAEVNHDYFRYLMSIDHCFCNNTSLTDVHVLNLCWRILDWICWYGPPLYDVQLV